MNDFEKTQWHPPFCAAVKLELRDNKKDLLFESERVLNTKPIQLDLLVIKKIDNADIQNEIGKIFLETGERLVLSVNSLSDKDDKENADSILQLALAENPNLFNRIKEVSTMCEALRTLMKPELDAAKNEARIEGLAEGRAEGIAVLSDAIKRLKHGEPVEKLLSEGFSSDTIASARAIIDELCSDPA